MTRATLVLLLVFLPQASTLGQDDAGSSQTGDAEPAFEGPAKILFSPGVKEWLEKPVDAFGFVFDEQRKPIPGVRIQAASPRQGFHSSFSMPYGDDDIEGKTAITDEQGLERARGIRTGWTG